MMKKENLIKLIENLKEEIKDSTNENYYVDVINKLEMNSIS